MLVLKWTIFTYQSLNTTRMFYLDDHKSPLLLRRLKCRLKQFGHGEACGDANVGQHAGYWCSPYESSEHFCKYEEVAMFVSVFPMYHSL